MELTGHLSEDTLIAYFTGELDGDRIRRVDHHVRGCAPCRRRFRIHRALFSGVVSILKKRDPAMTTDDLKGALQQAIKQNQIFYAFLHIPDFADILVATSQHGVVRIMLGNLSRFEFEERLKKELPRRWLVESHDETEAARLQLEQYFYRERTTFDLTIDPLLMRSEFQKQVLMTLQDIPYGHFITYGELARRLGKPKATQAVGMALARNPLPIVLPCHRVVASKGRLGGFSAGIDLKLKLLELEGVHYPHSTRQLDLFLDRT